MKFRGLQVLLFLSNNYSCLLLLSKAQKWVMITSKCKEKKILYYKLILMDVHIIESIQKYAIIVMVFFKGLN